MTAILILNAASSLFAAACLGALVAWQRRQAGRTVVIPVYVTPQPPPRRLGR